MKNDFQQETLCVVLTKSKMDTILWIINVTLLHVMIKEKYRVRRAKRTGGWCKPVGRQVGNTLWEQPVEREPQGWSVG